MEKQWHNACTCGSTSCCPIAASKVQLKKKPLILAFQIIKNFNNWSQTHQNIKLSVLQLFVTSNKWQLQMCAAVVQ
jgi:hypothetical protein